MRQIDGASTRDTDASTFKKLAMKPNIDWIYLAAQKLKTSRRIDRASTRNTDASTFKKLAMKPSSDLTYLAAQKLKTSIRSKHKGYRRKHLQEASNEAQQRLDLPRNPRG